MDSDDERILYQFWQDLDTKLIEIYEKECWRALPKLDKLVKERLGWRRREPDDDFERFNAFMGFIESVYLRPTLEYDVGTRDNDTADLWDDNPYGQYQEDDKEENTTGLRTSRGRQ